MAAIAGEISKQIKGHSEGALGFRPWWDTVEDNLMYAFVVLGEFYCRFFSTVHSSVIHIELRLKKEAMF